MTATVTTLRSLLAHNDWAQRRIVEAAAELTDAQLDRPFELGAGSLRGTLQHLWLSEHSWLEQWQGRSDPPAPPPGHGLPLADLSERFRETAAQREALLDDLGAGGESKRIAYGDARAGGRARSLPLGDLVLHVCNHGIHHRAQALNMLRHAGAGVLMLSYLVMKMAPSAGAPASFEPDTIAEYFRYGDWAQRQVNAAAAGLADEPLDRTFEMGMGSLRRTLLHVYDAEQWWLENWSGEPAQRFPRLAETTSVAELGGLLDASAGRRNDLLSSLRGPDLQRPVRVRPRMNLELSFALGDTMLDLAGHGTHHRAQALNMLRHLGAQVPAIDYIDWVAQGSP